MKENGAEIEFPGPAPINAAIKMSLPESWHGSTDGTATFSCSIPRDGGDGKLEGTVDGVELSGNDYVTASIQITSTINDYALVLRITTLGGSVAKCKIGW